MWKKKGLIYSVNGEDGWRVSHCHKPTPLLLDNNTCRVYFGVRDARNITRTTFVDLDVSDLEDVRINYIHTSPVLDIGKIGTFDDSGANVSSLVRVSPKKIYMYHIGWNPSTTVHTRNSIGISVSTDGGWTFERMFDGPILDRNKNEPYYTGAVDVKFEKGLWHMWYTYGHCWKIINGKPEICYYIRYASSNDGIDWVRMNTDCILPSNPYEAVARPSVIFDDNIYKMWYSKRSIVGFRRIADAGYRGGYAESDDGIHWTRKDHEFGLDLSPTGWDSEAIAYPYVIKIHNRYLMLYNGNGFGKTGFGYALSSE